MSTGFDRLQQLLTDAANGRFPPVDGDAEILRTPEPAGQDVVVEFTGHAAVVTSRDIAAVRARKPDGFGGASSPGFLSWLAGEGGSLEHHGVVLASIGEGAPTPPCPTGWDSHPRVRLANRTRTDIAVFGDDEQCVTLGRGLVGRWEVGVEVAEERRNQGSGRELLDAVRRSVAPGEPVFATAAPGNARALRTLIACGFQPIGAEVVINHEPR